MLILDFYTFHNILSVYFKFLYVFKALILDFKHLLQHLCIFIRVKDIYRLTKKYFILFILFKNVRKNISVSNYCFHCFKHLFNVIYKFYKIIGVSLRRDQIIVFIVLICYGIVITASWQDLYQRLRYSIVRVFILFLFSGVPYCLLFSVDLRCPCQMEWYASCTVNQFLSVVVHNHWP